MEVEDTKELSVAEKLIEIKKLSDMTNVEIAGLLKVNKSCITVWINEKYFPDVKNTEAINKLYEQTLKLYANYNKQTTNNDNKEE